MTASYRTDHPLGLVGSRGEYRLGFAAGKSNHRDLDCGTEAEPARSLLLLADLTVHEGLGCGERAGSGRVILVPIGRSDCPLGPV